MLKTQSFSLHPHAGAHVLFYIRRNIRVTSVTAMLRECYACVTTEFCRFSYSLYYSFLFFTFYVTLVTPNRDPRGGPHLGIKEKNTGGERVFI